MNKYQNIFEGFSALGLMALGGTFTIIIASALKVDYGMFGLYCFGFSCFCFIIILPYYLINKRKRHSNRKERK